MSLANVFGIAPYTWKPGPDFKATVGADSKWVGSQTFTCRKFDFSSTAIRNAFVKGATAPSIYPELGAEWNFLLVDEVSHEHEGATTKLYVTYKGYSPEWQFDKSADGETGTYSLSGSLTERPIIEHPLVKKLPYYNWLVDAYNGKLTRRYMGGSPTTPTSSTPVIIAKIGSNEWVYTVDDSEFMWWWNYIIDLNNRTWETSSFEWTKSATNKGGLAQETINKLGWIDPAPEGNPPTPTNGFENPPILRNWRMSGLTEQMSDTNANAPVSFTITWALSPQGTEWPAKIYTKP